MSVTLDISNANYYLVIIPLNDRIYFVPCSLLAAVPLDNSLKDAASLQIKDSCVTNRNRDKILGIGDHSIEDYINQTGTEDCVFVDNLIDKMLQTSTDNQPQSDIGLIQLFMDHAILQAIKNSGTYSDVNEDVLKSWIYIFVTPIGWGKRVTSDALFSVFAGSRFITPSSALTMAAFNTLLFPYLYWDYHAEQETLPNSKNILCELFVGKTGDASLSMNIFSITKLKGPQHVAKKVTIDPSLSVPTVFSNNRIQLHAGHKNLVALLRDAVKETIGLSMQFCNELLNQLCGFLYTFERKYQEDPKRLDQICPFQASEIPPTIAEEDISALRLITLMDILAVLLPQWEPIIPEIQSLIERQICITRVFFTVIPEVPHLYPDPIEDALFISIMLFKFKLEAISVKKFKYVYDNYKRFCSASQMPYTAIEEHIHKMASGAGIKLVERLEAICQESPPLSSLAPILDNKSNIDTINYVYLSTTQVHIQSLGVDMNRRPIRLRAQKSEYVEFYKSISEMLWTHLTSSIITLDQFLVMNTKESKSEETMLQFHISTRALSLLESLFPKALHEFATLYSEPKEEPTPEDNIADVSCFNVENWYNTLHRKYDQLFHSESKEHRMNYTKVMADLIYHHLDSDSPCVHMTQQKHIGTFLMVYFGYLKETLAKDFGQDSDSTRYILMFEHLMRNVTIGHIDNTLMRKVLDQCGWVPETEKSKRKLMVYDIEDNFPISECLQQENIRMIPAKIPFVVVTITRYYTKMCLFQALEDILPSDKHYKIIKGVDYTFSFDFYETICDKIWHRVLESIYETDHLLEYPANIDIMDLEFTLEAYKSFKVVFTEYMLNTFAFTYTSHPDEKHRFPLHLKQGNCSIVLTNRLVLLSGVIPAFTSSIDLVRKYTDPVAFVFYRPSNFDDEKNLSLPMLRLIETEAKKLLENRFRNMIRIYQRQFSSVHSHQCLKLVNGDTPFGFEALKTGVIRAIEPDAFALGFRYFNNENASFVEAVNKKSGSIQPIQETEACIITKFGAPYDNSKKHDEGADLGLKITDHKNVSKVLLIQINDPLQRNIGDIVTIQDYNHTTLSVLDAAEYFSYADIKKFPPVLFFSLYLRTTPLICEKSILLESDMQEYPLVASSITRPQKLAYFDSYEER